MRNWRELSFSGHFLCFEVLDGGLDSVLSQHGAVELDRWQLKVLGNVLVLNFHGVLHGHALEDFSCVGATSDRRSTAEGLEDCLLDGSVGFIDLDLEFHDVTTGGCADKSGANAGVFFVEGAHISGVFVVVEHILVISKVSHRHIMELGANSKSLHVRGGHTAFVNSGALRSSLEGFHEVLGLEHLYSRTWCWLMDDMCIFITKIIK